MTSLIDGPVISLKGGAELERITPSRVTRSSRAKLLLKREELSSCGKKRRKAKNVRYESMKLLEIPPK